MSTTAQHKSPSPDPKGIQVERRYTKAGQDVFDLFTYETRTSVIRNPAGDTVFEMKNVEVPKEWSQVATDILAQKYFRRAGVPQPDGSLGSETSAKQTIHRVVNCWRVWGERHGYFRTTEDAQTFYDELVYMMLAQMGAPNSPQWFNSGLHESYGIDGPPQGHWFVDPETGEAQPSTSAYERPQPHACFILSVNDDLVNEGGLMDLWVREARIFKYGSGVGTNYSNVRAEDEELSGGGYSSGLMSFLKVGDRAAGAIKSGGTTRRAAKMVILDADHPEILEFIRWKVEEEKKVAALIAAGYSSDYEGEAYRTVSGQNSNNSVRLTADFFETLKKDGDWHTRERTSGKVRKSMKARALWDEIAKASWACADPGLQFHTTINDWHTCPEDGEIRASNPCSEYMFLDDTACNLASVNLRKFFDDEKLEFDVVGYRHACRLWTVALEISVLMAQFPSKEIADLSYRFRTLGLGYANLGSLLMVSGIPYDSDRSRAVSGALSAIMTGTAYATSAELAAVKGPFEGYERNKEHMLRVVRNHRYAAYNANDYENLSVRPMGINPSACPKYLLEAAGHAWDQALQWGQQYGFRNAQTTVIAPTGTIGLLMDCDTTGIEPDFALVKFKKLSGGGYFKIINQSVPLALRNLGYTEQEVQAIVNYVKGHATLHNAPGIHADSLKAKGLTKSDLEHVESQLVSAFDVRFAFSTFTIGEESLQRMGFKPEQYNSLDFDLLSALGYSEAQIDQLNEYVCGTMTIEGAPFLKEEHYNVFDCANKCGAKGQRFIHPHGHIRMMAAAQSFISGAISKTINLPHEASWQDIEECHFMSWQLGTKALSIYRDGSKLSQPLSSKSKKKEEKSEETTESTQAVEFVKNIPATSADLVQAVRQMLREPDGAELQAALRKLVSRKPLPQRRYGFTQKNNIGGQTIYLRTGEYDDGNLGEIFIDMHKEGATLRSLLNCFAISVSIGLQYGVPLDEFVDKFAFTRFEPSGPVDHPNLRSATSIIDYIFRLLAFEYLDRDDLVQVSREDTPNVEPRRQSSTSSTVRSDNRIQNKIGFQTPATAKDAPSNLNAHITSIASASAAPTSNGAGSPVKTGNGSSVAPKADANQQLIGSLMGDAPACNVCGHLTIRNGTCYKCLNCGNSMGCS